MLSLRLAVPVCLVLIGAGLSQPVVVRSQGSPATSPAPAPAAASATTGAAATTARETLDRYCVTCHNQKSKTAGLTLDTLNLQDVPAHADTWEAVVRRLRTGTMPPVNMPRPDGKRSATLVQFLEGELDRAAGAPRPGRALLRRLNRAEYGN